MYGGGGSDSANLQIAIKCCVGLGLLPQGIISTLAHHDDIIIMASARVSAKAVGQWLKH